MNIFRWFISQDIRNACAVHKHYRRLLASQRDILSSAATSAVQVKLDELAAAIKGGKKDDFVTKADGTVDSVGTVTKFLIFNIRQSFTLGGVEHTIWFPPDLGESPSNLNPLVYRAGLIPGRTFKKGDDVVRIRMNAGDHLFVDRLTYNFCKPERGEIVVFATVGTQIEAQDQFYIKRLCV